MSKIAIVTPYYKESRSILERCLESVAQQSVSADHILVADGFSQDWIGRRKVRHLVLDRGVGNFGNTPRAIGAMLAIGGGYDAIGFLDADNWLERDHLEQCLRALESFESDAVDYVLAKRILRRPDGSELTVPKGQEGFEADTNCCLFFPGAYHLLHLWGMIPKEISVIADRILFQAARQDNLLGLRSNKRTVNYVTHYAGAYAAAGEAPPPWVKWVDFDAIGRWINALEGRELEIAERMIGVPFEKDT